MSVRQIALCSLYAALTAVLAQIALPIGLVPINLATLAVLLAGVVLGAELGALSQLIYLLLGACGAPVFAFFSGGLGILTGPTGGFIVGYVVAAWLVGIITAGSINSRGRLLLGLIVGACSYFALGSIWFMLSTAASWQQTAAVCVLPFLPGDVAKIAAVMSLAPRLVRKSSIR